jgi:hypothetical protein
VADRFTDEQKALAEPAEARLRHGAHPTEVLEEVYAETGEIVDMAAVYVILEERQEAMPPDPARESCIRMMECQTADPSVQRDLLSGDGAGMRGAMESFLNLASLLAVSPSIPKALVGRARGQEHLLVPLAATRFAIGIIGALREEWRAGSAGPPPVDALLGAIAVCVRNGEPTETEIPSWLSRSAGALAALSGAARVSLELRGQSLSSKKRRATSFQTWWEMAVALAADAILFAAYLDPHLEFNLQAS